MDSEETLLLALNESHASDHVPTLYSRIGARLWFLLIQPAVDSMRLWTCLTSFVVTPVRSFAQDNILVMEYVPRWLGAALTDAVSAGDRHRWVNLMDACLTAVEKIAAAGIVSADLRPDKFRVKIGGRWATHVYITVHAIYGDVYASPACCRDPSPKHRPVLPTPSGWHAVGPFCVAARRVLRAIYVGVARDACNGLLSRYCASMFARLMALMTVLLCPLCSFGGQ